MAIHKTEAVILRRQEVRETSVVLTAYSRHLGKFQGLVKGARGARSAVPWCLEPVTLQSIILYERRRSPWALVTGCDLLEPFDAIRRDLNRTAYASFCLEMVEAMTGAGDPSAELYELLVGVLRVLEAGGPPRRLARLLEARLLRVCGLLPDLNSLALGAEPKALLQQLLSTPLGAVAGIQATPAAEEGLRRFLQGLCRNVLQRELKSRAFLYSIGLESAA